NPSGATPGTQTVTVNANGSVPDSMNTLALAAGSYSFIAVYSGDSVYVGSVSPIEPLTVTPPPTVTTQQSATVAAVGAALHDTARVTGGITPYDANATVTFRLFDNPNGTGTALFTDTETLVNGTATSKSFTPTVAGTDYWVATFNGDSHNPVETSGLAAEPV